MKTKYIFLILCFLGIAMGSCKDDSASNPTFADDELYIYTDMLESVSAIAGTLTEFPILVSPADGSVSVKWLLDRKSTRLNSSHNVISRMPSSA